MRKTGELEKEISEARVRKGELALWWIGQAGFVFKLSTGKVIMADPYLSYSMESMTYIHDELPMDPRNARADATFCSHDHDDHTDEPTLKAIASNDPATIFYGPTLVAERIKEFGIDPQRVKTLNRGEKVTIDESISAEAVYARHTEDSVGFIFRFAGVTIYYTGDTEVGLDSYIHEIERVRGLQPDIFIVCINSGYNNLGPKEAARLTMIVEPRLIIPMHYDLIEENTIDPHMFLDALQAEDMRARVKLMEYGGYYLYRT